MNFKKLVAQILTAKTTKKSTQDKYAAAVAVGREQFKKLVDKGLTVPVVLL